MPKGIVLRPDAEGCTAIRALRDLLHEAELPSLASHRKGEYEPHLSLTVADDLPHEVLDDLRADQVRPSGTVVFDALSSFSNGVLHLPALPDKRLLKAQAHAYQACLASAPWRHYVPGTWTPHVTLGYAYTPRQIGRAAELLLPLLPLRLTGWTAWLEDATTGEAWPIA